MANIDLLFPKIIKYEGGFVNDPTDMGGATNKGVTLATWRQLGYDKDGDGDIDAQDIRLLSEADAKMILKVAYWDRWRADAIKNQSVAEILVDWVWGSGKWGIVIPQRILAVTDDGRVGMQTINALNSANQEMLHSKIKTARLKFIDDLIARLPAQKKFENGWKRRINEYTFQPTPGEMLT